jgi:hypothetical protein
LAISAGSFFFSKDALRLADRGAHALDELEDRLRRACANISASMTSLSVASAAPPSTITIASFEHGHDEIDVALRLLLERRERDRTRRRRARRGRHEGPAHGMSEMCSAALAAVIARTSVGLSLSLDRTVAMICVSFRKPSGKSGRRGDR